MVPVIEALLGMPSPERDRSEPGVLGRDMAANDEREDYLRSSLILTEAGWEATPFERQDSSMLGLLARAQALAIRPVFAPAARKGDPAAFAQILEHWDRHLRAFVHHTLGGDGATERVINLRGPLSEDRVERAAELLVVDDQLAEHA